MWGFARNVCQLALDEAGIVCDEDRGNLSEDWPQDLNERGEFGFLAIERYLRNLGLRTCFFLVEDKYAGFGLVDLDVCLP